MIEAIGRGMRDRAWNTRPYIVAESLTCPIHQVKIKCGSGEFFSNSAAKH
jgi:hypothetical protein